MEMYRTLNVLIKNRTKSKRQGETHSNHDRMYSGRRYCLLVTIHEATHRGCRALPKPMWSPTSIADMMRDDFNVTKVVLDHNTAILYVG